MSVRPRRNFPTIDTTGDAGALGAGTTNGLLQVTPEWARGAIITLIASAASGSCTFQLQYSPDGGTTWNNYGPVSTALTAAGNTTVAVYPSNWSATAGATPTNMTVGGTVATLLVNAPMPPVWRLSYSVGTSMTISSARVGYIA
jgi:hypothetical protein